jgi:hypothetical protein
MLDVLARIRHRRARRRLSPYLDGMLSDTESRRLEAHLAQCLACRDELAELRATVQSLSELPLAEAPRSFALTAAPERVAALPPSRRLELGLGFATAAAAFVLALVAFGDLLGVPDEDAEQASPKAVNVAAVPTVAGTSQALITSEASEQPPEGIAEADRAHVEAPTAPPAAMGGGEEATAGAPEASVSATVPDVVVPGVGQTATAAATVAATATVAAVPPLAATPAPATTPGPGVEAPAETPLPAEAATPTGPVYNFAVPSVGTAEALSPTEPPEKAVATATATPAMALAAPAEPEGNVTVEGYDQALAESQRQSQAAEEDEGPSRETVVRWLEIGLGAGMALLFVSWVLARRWGRA